MRNFWALLNLSVCISMTGKHLCRRIFLKKCIAGTIQLYLNETPTQVLPVILLSSTGHLFAEHLWKVVSVFCFFVFFSIFTLSYVKSCKKMNYVNVNQFKNKFHVMWIHLYLHEVTTHGLYLSRIYCSSCIVFKACSA